ncbi:MAG: transposase [Acidobacteria bacterium]|nr:MAG: transposase [Acidobacteriota bacterium]
MKAAADALQKLAADPRYLGARLGALAVLHTWTRAMLFHPHVHMLVTAGGLTSDGQTWIEPKYSKFLVPDPALSIIFRAKFCDGLKKAGLLSHSPVSVWKKNWVVHSQHAGRGDMVLDYLARYLFRIAISNSRIESIDNSTVRFRYRDNRSQQIRRVTLTGVEFIARFLQHVLPRGATKVRNYGIFSPSSKSMLARACQLLPQLSPPAEFSSTLPPAIEPTLTVPVWPTCPLCRTGTLVLIGPVERSRSP